MVRGTLGNQIVMTSAVHSDCENDPALIEFVNESLKKFSNADWGDTSQEDAEMNTASVKAYNENNLDNSDRLLAVYNTGLCDDGKIWIITEWDRSVTTILYPSDY